jgi:hypothetical protein
MKFLKFLRRPTSVQRRADSAGKRRRGNGDPGHAEGHPREPRDPRSPASPKEGTSFGDFPSPRCDGSASAARVAENFTSLSPHPRASAASELCLAGKNGDPNPREVTRVDPASPLPSPPKRGSATTLSAHPRVSGGPGPRALSPLPWIPACAGMSGENVPCGAKPPPCAVSPPARRARKHC